MTTLTDPLPEASAFKPGKLSARLTLWLDAIRDAYIALLPLTLMGAISITIAQNPYPPYIAWMTQTFGVGWQSLGMGVFNATMGIMGFAGAASICLNVSLKIHAPQTRNNQVMITVAAVAGSAFLMMVIASGPPDFKSLGYVSAFQSIISGIACAELMHFFNLHLPRSKHLTTFEGKSSLNSALRMSFAAMLSLSTLMLASWLFKSAGASLLEQLNASSSYWLLEHNPGAAVLNAAIVVINQLLWTVGINGGQFLLHLGISETGLINNGSVLYDATSASPMFVNAFAHLGGAGATWGLILYCIIQGKDHNLKMLAWYSVLPAILNVNELLLFGIPLVLSRTLLIPFIAAPLFNCLLATLAIHTLGLTLEGQAVGWSTPILISGYLMSNSWLGPAVQLVAVIASIFIYAPFVRVLEAQREQRSKDILKSALSDLCMPESSSTSQRLKRSDSVGDVARRLVQDFRADLGSERVRLFYQPQHDKLGGVVGVEALLRWTHATYGPIPTQAIVNVAEECDLIHLIGEWVINRACEDAARWRIAGYDGFKISFNMSPLQLESATWVNVVRESIARHGLKSQDMDAEITEGQAMSFSGQANQNLSALQSLNIPLSMDDFGMGCTSLLYMERFQMYAIKLDGILTRNVLDNAVNQEVIRCICALGRTQGVHIVAEYVETTEQKHLLENLGCNYFQGWLFSPALPEDELLPYLDRIKAECKAIETTAAATATATKETATT